MKVRAYSVRDKVAGAFLPLFFLRSDGEAMRSFSDAVNDPKHQFSPHAADYDLFWMGTFDDETGMLEGPLAEGEVEVSPVRLASGLQVQVQK